MSKKNTQAVKSAPSVAKGKPAAVKAPEAVKPAVVVAPVAPPAPLLTTVDARGKAAQEAAANGQLKWATRGGAPFCVRAGQGSRAWLLDHAICSLHVKGERLTSASMQAEATRIGATMPGSAVPTLGSHMTAMIERGFVERAGDGSYKLTAFGLATAGDLVKPAAPVKPALPAKKGK